MFGVAAVACWATGGDAVPVSPCELPWTPSQPWGGHTFDDPDSHTLALLDSDEAWPMSEGGTPDAVARDGHI